MRKLEDNVRVRGSRHSACVFPVLISGISHFVEGVRTIGYWRRYRIKLQGYAAVIETQRVFYLNTLEGLFADIVQSDEDLNLMMAEPGGLVWQRPEYDLRLRERLDRSYDIYVKTINRLVENLSLMCRELGVDQHGDVRRHLLFTLFFTATCVPLDVSTPNMLSALTKLSRCYGTTPP